MSHQNEAVAHARLELLSNTAMLKKVIDKKELQMKQQQQQQSQSSSSGRRDSDASSVASIRSIIDQTNKKTKYVLSNHEHCRELQQTKSEFNCITDFPSTTK